MGHTDKHVWVEAESSRIGRIHVPPALWSVMDNAPQLAVSLPLSERVRHTISSYPYWVDNPDHLKDQLRKIKKHHGQAKLDFWCSLVDDGDWPALVRELLVNHYDYAYRHGASEAVK